MQEIVVELTSNPLLVAAAIASFIGLFIYWSYGGFINENYRRIKWFRRLFLPHVTRILKVIDDQNENTDFDGVYVKTDILSQEHAFDLFLEEEKTKDEVIDDVGNELLKHNFRPEVILASLGTNPAGRNEIGNFVLTAPEKEHFNAIGIGRVYEIIMMFMSKHQLHIRIFYDPEKHRLRFYAHYELNPYNPFVAKRHLQGKSINFRKGVDMAREYAPELEKYGVEVVK